MYFVVAMFLKRFRLLRQAFLAHPPTASAGAILPSDITEDGLALFGSVVAEVDRWYKRQVPILVPRVFWG